MSQTRLASRVPPPSAVLNPFVPIPSNGTLELWYFIDAMTPGVFVGWFAPNVTSGQLATHGLVLTATSITVNWLTGASFVGTPASSQWNHVAMSWSGTAGFLYVNGTQQIPINGPGPIGGGRVHFFIGDNQTAPTDVLVGGFVTEVATYAHQLSVGDLDGHFDQAELKGTRPAWKIQTTHTDNPGGGQSFAYTKGVTHVARQGSGSFQIPTGLRGVMLDIQEPKPPGRVSAGTPPYLWDVGWVSILDGNGMLEERRPNRDTLVWLPERMPLATVFTHDFLPGWVVDITELDPA